MNTFPFNRLPRVVGFGELDDVGLVYSNHAMAVHAHVERGHGGMLGMLGRAVAIQTRDVIIARMNLVAEGNGLGRRIPFVAPGPHKHVVAKYQESYGVD